MELMLDTINLEAIKQYTKIFPVTGITSNPSIIKKEGEIDFFEHFKQIRQLVGDDVSIHVQVTAETSEGIIKEAEKIVAELGDETYIKIPVNLAGLEAIQVLKQRDFNITATGIYTMAQGDYSILNGVDYIAPYFNRMDNINIDPEAVIAHFAQVIKQHGSNTKILAASFKNVGQVMTAYEKGAEATTVSPDLLRDSLTIPYITKAVDDFKSDWEAVYGSDVTIDQLS